MINQTVVRKTPTVGFWVFALCVGASLSLGFVSGLLSGATGGYADYVRPSFTPPDIVFSIVWPILYFLIGVSFFLVLKESAENGVGKTLFTATVIAFAVQFGLNLLFPFVFFSLRAYTAACIVTSLVTAATLTNVILAFRVNKWAGITLLPYLAWLSFATVLNVFVAVLNG